MKPASILVTDDESGIRLMLKTALETEGYDVAEAADGRQALEAVRRQPPDVMVLDLNMPALDGMGVLEQMKELAAARRPRVIVLTAYGSVATAVKAARLGATDFLEKPVLLGDLRESVAAALRERPPEPDAGLEEYERGYAGVLDRVRRALRLAKYTDAEGLLMRAADLSAKDPAYFNLLGVLYEARKQWRLAKKFYGKAVAAGKDYAPAQQNLRRIYELSTFGKSEEPVALGDATEIWYARLPDVGTSAAEPN